MSAPTKAMLGCAVEASVRKGSSCAQGPHHDAQKLMTTGLPRRSWTPTLCPSSCWMARAGAVRPSRCGLDIAACCRPHASETIRTVPRTIAPAEIKPDLRFNVAESSSAGNTGCAHFRRAAWSVRERARGRDPSVQVAAGLDRPLQRLAIHRHQPEMRAIPARPLEIVRVRPVEVAADVDSITDRKKHVLKRFGKVTRAPFIVIGCEPVLCDVHRFAQWAQLVQDRADPRRVCAESHVGDPTARNVEAPDELVLRPPRIERAHLSPVVRDADVVACGLHDPGQPSWCDWPAIQRHLRRLRGPAVAPPLCCGDEEQLVM